MVANGPWDKPQVYLLKYVVSLTKLSAGYRGIIQQIVESALHFLSVGPVKWEAN